jgi:hypothetical protein
MPITTPTPGQTNWDAPLNTALNTLESEVEAVGPTANTYTDTQLISEVSRANGAYLAKLNNLSDLNNAPAARSNLGLGNSATRNVGTTSGTVMAGDDSRVTAPLSVFNVKTFGLAVGNGIADDTVAVQNTINAASAAGGGIVYFPAGSYLLTPTSSPALTIPSNIQLIGEGRKNTVLIKNANGILISASGPATDPSGATHVRYCSFKDFSINGNNKTGFLFQFYYADNLVIRDLYMSNNQDICIAGVEFWDSRFFNIVTESCGGQVADSLLPNVLLQNSVASSGFGFSTDNNNQIYFIGCRWEAFQTGAVWIKQGVSNTNNPNGIHFTDCKMESSLINGGPFLLADASCVHIGVDHLYCFAGNFFGSYSTPVKVINWAAAHSSLENVIIVNGATNTVNLGVDLFAGNGSTAVLNNVVGKYTTAPTGSHIYLEPSTTGAVVVRNCRSTSGVEFDGFWPHASGNTTNKQAYANTSDTFSRIAVIGDTQDRYFMDANGTANWGSGSASVDVQMSRTSAGVLSMNQGSMAVQPGGRFINFSSATGALVYSSFINGNSNDSLQIKSAGDHYWGPGTAIQDTNLYRAGVGVLKTDNTFVAGNGLNVANQATLTGATSGATELVVQVTGDTNPRLYATAGGVLNLGPGNAATDTNIYRGGVGIVQTDSSLQVAGTVTSTGTLTATNAASVGGNLTVTGTTTSTGTLTATNAASVGGNLTVTGTTTSTGTLTATNAASVGGNLTVTGSTTSTGTLIASNAATVGTTLSVTGTTTSTGTLAAVNNATVGGTLSVTGTTTSTGTLAAVNNATVGGTLTVTGTTTSTGTLAATNNATVGGTLSITGTTTVSGGVIPANSGFRSFGTGGMINTLNTSSGLSVTTVAGTIYWAAVYIPYNFTSTGLIVSIGSVGGTDKWILSLYNSAGTLVANSATAGITVGTANTKQAFAFTSTVGLVGPGVYYVALQSNGTTAKFLAFNNNFEGFTTGSVAGTFGTLPSIAPGSGYIQGVGPFANTY